MSSGLAVTVRQNVADVLTGVLVGLLKAVELVGWLAETGAAVRGWGGGDRGLTWLVFKDAPFTRFRSGLLHMYAWRCLARLEESAL